MRKFAVALVGAVALSALTAGAASAHCPAAESSDRNTPAGAPLPGVLEVNATELSVYGAALGLGYGESDFGTNGNNVTYEGEIAGAIGHGEIEDASVGADGVSGTADGGIGVGPASAEGSGSVNLLSSADPPDHVSVGGNVAGEPVACTTVPLP